MPLHYSSFPVLYLLLFTETLSLFLACFLFSLINNSEGQKLLCFLAVLTYVIKFLLLSFKRPSLTSVCLSEIYTKVRRDVVILHSELLHSQVYRTSMSPSNPVAMVNSTIIFTNTHNLPFKVSNDKKKKNPVKSSGKWF